MSDVDSDGDEYDSNSDSPIQRLQRARHQVDQGHGFVEPHKNTANSHASSVDGEALVDWFRGVAAAIGDSCPIRFRRQRKSNDAIVRYTTREMVSFLPAYLTWKDLYAQYKTFHQAQNAEAPTPSFISFYNILTKRCKNTRIASPRSNVCDICAIYRAQSSRSPTTVETENQASHALDARAMRQQYAKDAGLVGSKRFVSTIDFAQNIAMPHSASSPSAWYFLSLIGVSVFGVYLENTKSQTNYIYSERVAGKGSNEVASMLHEFAVRTKIYTEGRGAASWTVYADNCGGQNKNSHLIRYLLFLVDSGRLRSASLYFLVKGHTKNNCDRGFGLIKRAYAKKDLYTMEHVNKMVQESAVTNSSVCLEDAPGVFLDWKSTLQPVYRDLKGIQSYQLFNFSSQNPGTVTCRKRPTGEPVEQKLLKTATNDFEELWRSLVPLPKCGPNPEKVTDLHQKILPYIPDEFKNSDLYRPPTEEERASAKSKKRSRKKITKTLLERAAENSNNTRECGSLS